MLVLPSCELFDFRPDREFFVMYTPVNMKNALSLKEGRHTKIDAAEAGRYSAGVCTSPSIVNLYQADAANRLNASCVSCIPIDVYYGGGTAREFHPASLQFLLHVIFLL